MKKQWEDIFIDVDGVNVHYLEAGNKEEEMFFLIHGGGMGSCAEVNYGEDHMGKGIPLPQELSYLS